VKERLCGGVVGAGSGIGPYLAGAPWWAVALVIFVVMFVTYGVVCWLATNTRAGRISTILLTWEALSEREPEAPPPRSRKWWRKDAA
jgi:hypothetical protein